MTAERHHNGGPMDEGWIKKHRSVRDHWLVGHGHQVKPADPSRRLCLSKGEAWEDLIMECKYEDGTVNNGGRKMQLRRGELLGAISWLAHRWNWTPKTVRTFLIQLESDGMISLIRPASEKGVQKGRQSNVISVCNYDKYQNVYVEEGQPEGQAKGDQRATRGQPKGDIYKEKKGRREEGSTPLSPPSRGGTDDLVLNADAEQPQTEVGEDTAPKRGERLPADWVLPRSWGQWALEHYAVTADQIRTEAASFADFWHSKPGAGARKIDWKKVWQNWIRSSADRKKWKLKRAETGAAEPIEDAPPPKVVVPTVDELSDQLAKLDDAEQQRLVQANANGIWPTDKLGYPPGHERCPIRPNNFAVAGITTKTYDDRGFRRRGRH